MQPLTAMNSNRMGDISAIGTTTIHNSSPS